MTNAPLDPVSLALRPLLVFSGKASAPFTPEPIRRPYSSEEWAALSNRGANGRREHLRAFVVRVLALGGHTSLRSFYDAADEQRERLSVATAVAPTPKPTTAPGPVLEPAPLAARSLPYSLPCALGCGQTRPVGSPLARVWRCDNHPRPKQRRRPEDAA